MKTTFYSNGKLLLTGEYVVLDGALSLALPTQFGQYLHISPGENKQIHWKSFDSDKTLWFEDVLLFNEIITKKDFGIELGIKNTLVEILHQAFLQNPDFINNSEGYFITTELTFPRLWGLGTSSTLINNIAQWLNIDAFELLHKSFGGSGYDIACAQNDTPITYQLTNQTPQVTSVNFRPDFASHLYFVYLNQKQSSKTAISNYYNKQPRIEKTVTDISSITNSVLKTETLSEFTHLLEKHEALLSKILETATVKESLFEDFSGTLKSLGAWGGDFVLAVSEKDPTNYFKEKGYTTILPYVEMIK
ncbi:GYDIA family GHMP kinase [Flavobacterium sp. SM15]|nr:GYDIA family GHMP kinase [Flavobacterium sp. SM15]MCG2609978.1 GYDIA family GHMP kinase [Flavobacterium sp. SM15]